MGVKSKDVDESLKSKGVMGTEEALKILNARNARIAKEAREADNKENWVQKLGRKVKEVIHGEKAYISKERAAEMKAARKAKKEKDKGKTTWTKQVESGLKQAGIDEDTVKRLRGKK